MLKVNRVIEGQLYKGIIEKDHVWSFSYNYFVKFHGKNIWELQHDRVITRNCTVLCTDDRTV